MQEAQTRLPLAYAEPLELQSQPMDLNTIRSALEAREFFLVYQPIVFLRDGLCFGGPRRLSATMLFATAAGVQLAQGHHFSCPLSVSDFKSYYAAS